MKLPFTIIRPFAVFDLESTGTSVTDKIVSIAVLKFFPDGRIDERYMVIDPECEIPKSASDIHGITKAVIEKMRADGHTVPTFAQIAKALHVFLSDCDLCAYNAMFDIPLLAEEFANAGIKEFPAQDVKVVDPMVIFKKKEPRNLTAGLMFYCGEVMDNAHHATSDTRAAAKVLIGQIAKYEDFTGITLEELANESMGESKRVDFAGKMVYDEDGKIVFNFGKHYNKKVYEIFSSVDPKYYDWLMGADFTHNTKSHFERLYNLIPKK